MALLNNNINNAKTVSDENTAMLPDNKQSKSAIITKKTNTLLIFIAVGMLGVFLIGALLTASRNQSDFSNVAKDVDASKEQQKLNDVPYIPPVVSLEPEDLKIENQLVGEEAFRQIMVSVLANPIKITDVSLSYNMDGLNLDSADCTAREKLSPNSSCTLNLSWTPAKKENKNLFIIVKYNELADENIDAKDAKKDISKKVNLTLQSKEPDVAPQPVQTSSVQSQQQSEPEDNFFFDEIEEDEEEEGDDYEISDDLAPTKTNEVSETKSKRIIKPDDCKKYASKAYDFSGTFIGWVQGNNDVYAPNCSHIIGNMEDDGMVIESGTGRVIGKGAVLDKKKSEEKRIELVLPLLDETMQAVSGPIQPDFEEIRANRQLVKSGDAGERRTTIGDEDIYRLEDTLGIYKDQQKKLIPFTIIDSSQLSSMPKDERYVLRQSKPIPAVLNRPVYFSSETGNDQNITATVERNVFGGDGRTVIIPSGSQLIGVAQYPGAVGIQSVQKINIVWNRLIRPDGAEFNLGAVGNYSADAQGRAGVPGKNDTEYMQQLFIKPLLYSALPVAMEAIFPSTSNLVTRVKRSDGTYNTIDAATTSVDDPDTAGDYGYAWNETQTLLDMTSKDKMKAEVQQNFKSVMQKLIEDSAKQQIPFTVPSGTRIQVFLNNDVMLRINDELDDLIGDGAEESANSYTYGGDNITVEYGNDSFGAESTSGATSFSGSNYRTVTDAVEGTFDEETFDEGDIEE